MKLGNVHIWAVPPCYVVELMILRNRVFRLRNVNMGSAVLQGGRSANIHELCFQAAKRSDKVCVYLQWVLFADCPESHFRSRNVQIIAVSSYKRVDLLIFTNIVSGCETLKYVQCSPAIRLNC